jgi:hypothetical protein
MPMTLAGPSTNHESDSEEDLDYIPDDGEHGIFFISKPIVGIESHIQFQTLALMSATRNVLASRAHHNLMRI